LLIRFLKDRSAGVAPMLALGIIPLNGSVGAAIDYSRANSVRAAMQAAGDATALMLTKKATSLNNTQLQQSASGFQLPAAAT
jgi:Flp pilus assembly protein TadG